MVFAALRGEEQYRGKSRKLYFTRVMVESTRKVRLTSGISYEKRQKTHISMALNGERAVNKVGVTAVKHSTKRIHRDIHRHQNFGCYETRHFLCFVISIPDDATVTHLEIA